MSRRRGSAITALLVLAMGLNAPLLQAEESLGRLFFTPERRAALDRARQLNIQEQQQVAQGDVVTVNGLVTRSSGKRTTWVNGVPITESHSGGLRAVPAPNRNAVRVMPNDRPPTTVTVGTSVNRVTGETDDSLGGGRIDVRPGSRKTP